MIHLVQAPVISSKSIFGDLYKMPNHFIELLQSRYWQDDRRTVRTSNLHCKLNSQREEKYKKLKPALFYLRYFQEMAPVIVS